ncbi:MAG: Phosphoglycerate mutase [Pseudonocardiales bacterium]|nr:Phosphoglycerate mutase [Pseudonocardiales bacterium]
MPASGPTRVFVLRHGRTAWNAQNRYQGQADPPLDEVGLAQASAAASLLATFAPDLIVTSDLQRASATAAALAAATGLTAALDPRLRERSLGHWEGLTRDEVEARFPEEFAQWRAGRNVARRGGETREQVTIRTAELFAALPSVPVIVLVTHSATALALTEGVLGLEHDRHILGPLANCHWSELQRTDESASVSWRMRAHNAGAPGGIVPHLPTEGDDAADSPDAEALDAAAR